MPTVSFTLHYAKCSLVRPEDQKSRDTPYRGFDNLIWPTCDHFIWPTPGHEFFPTPGSFLAGMGLAGEGAASEPLPLPIPLEKPSAY